jgi:hypothetical protein
MYLPTEGYDSGGRNMIVKTSNLPPPEAQKRVAAHKIATYPRKVHAEKLKLESIILPSSPTTDPETLARVLPAYGVNHVLR